MYEEVNDGGRGEGGMRGHSVPVTTPLGVKRETRCGYNERVKNIKKAYPYKQAEFLTTFYQHHIV